MVIIDSEPLLLIGALVALAAFYILLPIATTTYRKVRGPRLVVCPETNTQEVITIDAAGATVASLFGDDDRRILRCSRWPEHAGCDRRCARQTI